MPSVHLREFSERAIELARAGDRPIGQIAASLGISESCLRNWVKRADSDDGNREGVTGAERSELVELHRDARLLELVNEGLR
ncbi:transposase [Nocardia sp. CA-151230]|uniref:transposase n=1 Tax=Nocardia sp. CA-151230 TaxID=3239982 RepID=UPI003D8B2EED